MPESKPLTTEEIAKKKGEKKAKLIADLKKKPGFETMTDEEISMYLDSQNPNLKNIDLRGVKIVGDSITNTQAPENTQNAVDESSKEDEQKAYDDFFQSLLASVKQATEERNARLAGYQQELDVIKKEIEEKNKFIEELEKDEMERQRIAKEAEAEKAKEFIFTPSSSTETEAKVPTGENPIPEIEAKPEDDVPLIIDPGPEDIKRLQDKETGETIAGEESSEGEDAETEDKEPTEEIENNTDEPVVIPVTLTEEKNIPIKESEELQIELDTINEKIRNTPGWNVFRGTIYAIKQWQLEKKIEKAKQEEAKIEASKENQEKLFGLKSKYNDIDKKIEECHLQMEEYEPEDVEWDNLYTKRRLLTAEQDEIEKSYEQIKKKEYPFAYYLVDKIKNPLIKNLLTNETQSGEQYVSLKGNKIYYSNFAENPLAHSEITTLTFESFIKELDNIVKYNLSGFSMKIVNLEELSKDANERVKLSDPKARYEVMNPDGKKIIEQVDYNNALAIYEEATQKYINKVEKEFNKLTNK